MLTGILYNLFIFGLAWSRSEVNLTGYALHLGLETGVFFTA